MEKIWLKKIKFIVSYTIDNNKQHDDDSFTYIVVNKNTSGDNRIYLTRNYRASQ